MSHIHIPDGILPLWLWLSSLILIIIYLIGMNFYFRKISYPKILPLVGVFAALMLVAMSVEIVPIGYHINLAVLSGIFLGPIFSVLTIFIVTLISALIGHGGITVVGLNTLVVSVEAVAGFYLFRSFRKFIKSFFLSAFLASLLALIISTCVTLGIVYLGTGDIQRIAHSEHHGGPEIFETHLEEHHEEAIEQNNNVVNKEKLEVTNHEEFEEISKEAHFNMWLFMSLIIGLGSIGWLLESAITAFIVNYINKVKPDLLERNFYENS